jgi:hypothetical protein
LNDRFDGAAPDIHDVCGFLKDDLERVFSLMPRHDDRLQKAQIGIAFSESRRCVAITERL